jgi:menaquinone-dependent protoporphyrinogen IX oxidase
MKTLIVFYSRTGITKRVAQKMAQELGADIEELMDTDKRIGAWGYMKSGKEAMQKKLAVIEPLQYNPVDYDLVIIGTPTWAFAMSCAVRAYLTEQKGKIKNIALLATHGSDGGERAIKQMTELSGLVSKADLVLTSKEVLKEDYKNKLSQQGFIDGGNSVLARDWDRYLADVAQANTVIENIDKVPDASLTATERRQWKAEAKIFRSLVWFDYGSFMGKYTRCNKRRNRYYS